MSTDLALGSEKPISDQPNSTQSTAPKKPDLERSAEIIAAASGITFKSDNERFMLKEDFKLLVRTYVAEAAGSMSGFENTKKRRFDEINAYSRVKRYNKKAKEDGKPSLQERAKTDAEGRTMDDVSNFDEFNEILERDPQCKQRMESIMAEKAAQMIKESPRLAEWLMGGKKS